MKIIHRHLENLSAEAQRQTLLGVYQKCVALLLHNHSQTPTGEHTALRGR